jgi:hypothetical protein
MIWDLNSNAYITDKPFSKSDEPPFIATKFLDGTSSTRFLEFTGEHVSGTAFHAEPG